MWGWVLRPNPCLVIELSLPVGRLTEQTAEQRYEGDTDEGDTAACHQLLHTLRLRTRVVVTVAFQKIDCTPDTETCTQSNYQSLKNTNCAIEKFNIFSSLK